jgi:hypothetical protein
LSHKRIYTTSDLFIIDTLSKNLDTALESVQVLVKPLREQADREVIWSSALFHAIWSACCSSPDLRT